MSQNSLQKTCNAIGMYYKQMGRNDYFDDEGNGLFSKWFKSEEMAQDDMDDELKTRADHEPTWES